MQDWSIKSTKRSHIRIDVKWVAVSRQSVKCSLQKNNVKVSYRTTRPQQCCELCNKKCQHYRFLFNFPYITCIFLCINSHHLKAVRHELRVLHCHYMHNLSTHIKTFHAKSVDIFIIYVNTKLYKLSCNVSLVITITQNKKYRF
jgi:hypothetical protein